MKPDLTVAICAYNCERYIGETLSCLMTQTYRDFELLIVNDCSSDNSRAVITQFFEEHTFPHRIVDFEVNRGLAAGRRYVEENVQTKYIIFVDADDCPQPTFVEKLYRTITSDSDLMAVGCYLEFIDEDGNKVHGGQYLGCKTKDEFYDRAARKKLMFMASNAIFDRELALRAGGRAVVGFPDGKPRYQDLCEDLDLWTRMSDFYTEGKAIVVVPEVLMLYRKHSSGLSAGSFNMLLRMRHVKTNLLRRRAGEKELSFIEFRDSLSAEEMKRLERESGAADALRRGFFLLKQRKFVPAVGNILKSVWLQPGYLWQKVLSNSGIWKKK